MKKKIAMLLLAVMTISLVACSGEKEEAKEETTKTEAEGTESAGPKYDVETKDVNVSFFSFCGQLHQFIAADKGFLEEEGLNVKEITFDSAKDAMASLNAGTTDVYMTPSTLPPMNYIAEGANYVIFAGNMAEGGTPLFALKETEYTGYESLVGKRIATSRASSPILILKRELKEAGYDIEKDFEWVEINGSTMDLIQAVKNKEIDFAVSMTGFETVREAYGMKDVWYPDDPEPMYSCCRMIARKDWVEENPNTVKALLRAYMRAQYYFDDTDYTIELTMEKLDQDREKVEGYMLNPHYVIHLDPLRNVMLKEWEWAIDFGIIDNVNNIDIDDYVNAELYKEVLDDLTEENPDEQYYKDLQETFAEYDED